MKNLTVCALLCLALAGGSYAGPAPEKTEIWRVADFMTVSEDKVKVEGKPKLIDSAAGRVVVFNGEGDRILVNASPLAGADAFTVELLFKPDNSYPKNHDPRIVHIESPDNSQRRLVLEARLNKKEQWSFDAFIMSEKKRLPLLDETLVHPVAEWQHVAVTYNERVFSTYVNGVQELSQPFKYLPLPKNTRVSIGARMNRIHWFKGQISSLAFTGSALSVEQMPLLKELKKLQKIKPAIK